MTKNDCKKIQILFLGTPKMSAFVFTIVNEIAGIREIFKLKNILIVFDMLF